MEIGTLHVAATSEAIAEVDRLGNQIAELSAHLEAVTARLLDLIREFDARAGWNHGFRSCAHWLAWRVGMDLGAARERVRVARALSSLPGLADALARGELSYAKVRALTAWPRPRPKNGCSRWVEPGPRARSSGSSAAGAVSTRSPKRVRRPTATRAAPCTVYQDEDGMVVIRGRLTPEAGAVLMQALAAARETLYQRARGTGTASGSEDVSSETSTMAQQHADALALLAETALHQGLDPGAPGERYQVVVHVDAPVLADCDAPGQSVLEGGAHGSSETSRRLACDASRALAAIPDDPVPALRARNEVAGLRLDARTLCPSSSWERLDVGWAIDVLHPRALQPAVVDT
jgi:hypothetical protein